MREEYGEPDKKRLVKLWSTISSPYLPHQRGLYPQVLLIVHQQ